MNGRKYVYRRNLPHIEKEDWPHFVTFVTYRRWELPPAARDAVLSHCLHDNGTKLRVHAVVVMPDHVHTIFTPLRCLTGDPFTFEEIVGAMKGASAHSINRLLSRSGSVWLDESFDHVLRSAESENAKCEYICDNPVRKGLVARREDYRWLWIEPGCTAEGGCATQE